MGSQLIDPIDPAARKGMGWNAKGSQSVNQSNNPITPSTRAQSKEIRSDQILEAKQSRAEQFCPIPFRLLRAPRPVLIEVRRAAMRCDALLLQPPTILFSASLLGGPGLALQLPCRLFLLNPLLYSSKQASKQAVGSCRRRLLFGTGVCSSNSTTHEIRIWLDLI
jgi:hypothetical protein